MSLIVVG